MKLEEIMDLDSEYISDVEKEVESRLRALYRYLSNAKKRRKEVQTIEDVTALLGFKEEE